MLCYAYGPRVHFYPHRVCCIVTGSCRPVQRSSEALLRFPCELLVSVFVYQLQVSPYLYIHNLIGDSSLFRGVTGPNGHGSEGSRG